MIYITKGDDIFLNMKLTVRGEQYEMQTAMF